MQNGGGGRVTKIDKTKKHRDQDWDNQGNKKISKKEKKEKRKKKRDSNSHGY